MSEAARIGAKATARPRLRMSLSAVALGSLALGAAVYYAACGLLIHQSFHSYGWDLGIFDQVLWSIAHGHGFHYSFRNMWYLGDHFQPMLVFLAPLVFLKLGAAPILVVQGLAFGAAVVPLHAAVRRLGGVVAAWGLSLAYVVSLGAARAVSFDFHPECFLPALAFTALWGLAAERPGVFVAATLAMLPIKEDAAFLVLGLCWVGWLGFGQRKPAQWIALGAVAYLLVVSLAVIPLVAHGNSNPLAERYPYLGHSVSSIFFHAITRPDLIYDHLRNWDTPRTLLYLFAGTAFLPLLRPKLLLPILLLLVPPLLSVNDHQRMLELHYGVVPYAFTFVVAAMVLEAGYLSRMIRLPTPPLPKEKKEPGDTPGAPGMGLRPLHLRFRGATPRLEKGEPGDTPAPPAEEGFAPSALPFVGRLTDLWRTRREEARTVTGKSGGAEDTENSGVTEFAARMPSPPPLSRFAGEGRFVWGVAGLVAVLAIAMFAWKSPLPPSFAVHRDRFDVDHHSDVAETFVNMVPGDAIVSAQANFVPHLSERHDIFEFPLITPRATFVLVDDKRDVPGYDLPDYVTCRSRLPEFGFALVRAEDGIELWERSAEDAGRLGSEGCR
jgi:uncharacterized membrane protein